MKAYWQRKFNGKMSLEELVAATNWYLANEPKTLEGKNGIEILAILYGTNRRVKFENGVFSLE